MDNTPYILDETNDFAVVFKPPRMHCIPDKNKENKDKISIIEWYKKNYASAFDLVHRLDFETHGLILIARNEKSFKFFRSMQEKGEFIKEYSAICVPSENNNIEGFPDYAINLLEMEPSSEKPQIIMSYFRPYGPGRKQVRPVIDTKKRHKEIAKDRGGFYRTEIIGVNNNNFNLRIRRGFRHQIRCHLCWIGYPILNDPLYLNGGRNSAVSDGVKLINHHGAEQKECKQDVLLSEGFSQSGAQSVSFSDNLALKAHALFFTDPASGRMREYRISQMLHFSVK